MNSLFYIHDDMEALLGIFKYEMLQNPKLTLRDFCNEYIVDEGRFRRWIRRTGNNVVWLKREAELLQGVTVTDWRYDYCRQLRDCYFLFRMDCVFIVGLDVYLASKYGQYDRKHIRLACVVPDSGRTEGFAYAPEHPCHVRYAGNVWLEHLPYEKRPKSQLLPDMELTAYIYKYLLLHEPDLSLMEFCRLYGVDYGTLRSWMARNDMPASQVHDEVCKWKGEMPDDWRYMYAETVYLMYADVVEMNEGYTFGEFLRDFVKDIEFSLPGDPAVSPQGDEALRSLGVEDRNVIDLAPECFSRVHALLQFYAEELLRNPAARLRECCRHNHVSIEVVSSHMKGLGIKEKDMQNAAETLLKIDAGRIGAFVQVKPRLVSGNQLRGVLIELPDGTRLTVTDCTVESLKAFFDLYHDPNTKPYLMQDV